MPIRRPDHGCLGYSSSQNSVPWAFSSLVVQHDQAPRLNRIQATSTRGVHARIRRVAGCATPTGSAGHAGATANLKLTFHLDHSVGADHMRTTKHGRREKVRPQFDPHSIARLYRAPTPSNIRDRPDVENPDVGPFIAYYDAWNWLAERISLRETLPIDEAGSRAEKTIRDICMNTPEKLTMWGFRKADPDAELKSVTPQAWQGLSINPLYGQPETDLKAVGRRREYGAATKGKYGPVIWTGLCVDRRQFVAASVTARGNGPPSLAPAAQPVPQQAPPSSSRRGRRARYDWDEAKIVLLDALKQRGDFDETDQEN